MNVGVVMKPTPIKAPLILLLIYSLSGCATIHEASFHPIQPIKIKTYYPSISATTTKELGETLLSKKIETTADIIKTFNPIRILHILLPVGTYYAQGGNTEDIAYGRSNIFLPNPNLIGGFVIPKLKESGQIKNVQVWWHNLSSQMESEQSLTFSRGKETLVNNDFFHQELIYNGKHGHSIKFLYREFRGQMLNTPFTQEIQYDLNVSNTIGFKGARIEIIEATNQHIKYIVRKYFP